MDDASLGCIVRCLQLWDVDNVSAHASRSNEAAVGVILKLLAMHACSLHLLAPPVQTGSPGTVEGAVEIGGDDLAVMIDLSVKHRPLCPRDTGIGDEDVEAAIEFFDNLVNRFLDVLGIGDIDLVCPA